MAMRLSKLYKVLVVGGAALAACAPERSTDGSPDGGEGDVPRAAVEAPADAGRPLAKTSSDAATDTTGGGSDAAPEAGCRVPCGSICWG